MMMIIISTLCFVAGAVSALFVRKYIYDKFSPRKYSVHSFSRVQDGTGVYRMDFYVDSETVLKGYTKKIPPEGIKPDDLYVTIRTLHPMRGAYRVFWKIKD